MDWVKWIVILIAAVVWIVTNLMGGDKKAPKNMQKRPGPAPYPRPDPQEQARARRSPEDLNRLIEEARQRQRDAERRKQQDLEKRRAIAAARKPQAAEVVRRNVPATLIIEPPPPPRAVEAVPPTSIEKLSLVQMPMPVQSIGSQAVIAKGTARQKIRDLLSSRDALKAAMILREVLEPPLSRRRRRF